MLRLFARWIIKHQAWNLYARSYEYPKGSQEQIRLRREARQKLLSVGIDV